MFRYAGVSATDRFDIKTGNLNGDADADPHGRNPSPQPGHPTSDPRFTPAEIGLALGAFAPSTPQARAIASRSTPVASG